jgi:hypothetical protein
VNLTNEGLSFWYRTPDAPAPDDDAVVPRRGASIVLGVSPASPANAVLVRYRVDGGPVQTVPGRELRTDYQRQAQYFAVTFPAFHSGAMVEYAPMLTCAGRQVPAPHVADRFLSRFRLADRAAPPAPSLPSPLVRTGGRVRYPARVDFVGAVAVTFEGIEYVTDTPAGMRVNFFVSEGVVNGDGFTASVTPRSSDQLTVRRDGMGVIRIRAVFVTDDGATLDVEAGGYVDFGPDGYRQALGGNLPDRAPIVISPLISTRHPKYRWLNRIQCVGVGETRLYSGKAYYDIYSALPRDIPPTR